MPRLASPAPPIVGDTVRVTFEVLAENEQAFFSIDYMSNQFSASPAADAVLLGAEVETAAIAHLKACLAADTSYEGLAVAFLSRADISTQFIATGSGVGTVAGSHLPKEMSARLQKTSVLKGAHGRGGMSVGPVPISFTTPATNPNLLNAAAILAYAALAADLSAAQTIVGGSGATFSPCISTRPLLGTSIVTRAQVIAHLTVDPAMGTVRRRKPGRGI